ncbi:Peroxin-3 [Sporodiniella umbellata]|nr:Peroxin-3 [Sporodiniella umbellata]
MTLITSVKDYVKRHQRGLMATAIIAGGGYLAGKYATNRIRDVQEKATSERLAKENLKRRFQQNQNDCVFTVISLLPTLSDQLLNEINIEAEWAKLQKSRDLEKIEKKLRQEREAAYASKDEDEVKELVQDTQEDKLDASVSSLSTSVLSDESSNSLPEGILDKGEKQLIWEEIKINSFVRTFTSIYSVTLLTLLSHVQLNLLGRYTYMWSVSILNKSEPALHVQPGDSGYLDPQIEHMFLSLSWWLLHRGWKKCAERVEEAVEHTVGSMSLKQTVDYKEAQELAYNLRGHIEFEDNGNATSYLTWMLPDTEEEVLEVLKATGFDVSALKKESSGISFQRLLDEARDYIDSPDFDKVAASCFNEVFAIFDQYAFAKTLLPDLEEGVSIQEITEEKTLTLAKLLPIISRQSHLVIAGNEYLNAFAYIKELQAFSAMIYTQFDEQMEEQKN